MPTRIEKDYIFEAGIHFEDAFTINVFEMTLGMEVITENINEQTIAIERMDHFVYNNLQNCVFVSQEEEIAIEKYKKADLNVCVLNDEPYDQIIASLIMIKINTILENRLNVEDIMFGSKITGGIRFTITYEDLPKDVFEKNWWTTSDCKINNFDQKDGNIVNLFRNNDWIELELDWKSKDTA